MCLLYIHPCSHSFCFSLLLWKDPDFHLVLFFFSLKDFIFLYVHIYIVANIHVLHLSYTLYFSCMFVSSHYFLSLFHFWMLFITMCSCSLIFSAVITNHPLLVLSSVVFISVTVVFIFRSLTWILFIFSKSNLCA